MCLEISFTNSDVPQSSNIFLGHRVRLAHWHTLVFMICSCYYFSLQHYEEGDDGAWKIHCKRSGLHQDGHKLSKLHPCHGGRSTYARLEVPVCLWTVSSMFVSVLVVGMLMHLSVVMFLGKGVQGSYRVLYFLSR